MHAWSEKQFYPWSSIKLKLK